jgi:protein TonB
METKKNAQHDVHKKSFRFFLIGLSVSVTLAIIAFEWTTEKLQPPIVKYDTPMQGYIAVLSNVVDPIRTDNPPAIEKKMPATEKRYIETVIESSEAPPLEIELPQSEFDATVSSFGEPETDTTSIVIFAEFQPQPVGGYESFYEHISKNMKYPRAAIKGEVQGKVFVEFIVDRKGSVSQLKIAKGIGSGCDEEAMRVLALTKWEAGKQRGKPVNVRMIMPISFKLQ